MEIAIFIPLFLIFMYCLILIFKGYVREEKFVKNIRKVHPVEDDLSGITSSDRGTPSERDLILRLLDMGIPEKAIFHDVYLKKRDDNYSQIDVVVPTKVGILVFEVKDYSGWIYGKGNQSQWTQVLSFGREKHHFYNPVKQNAHHIFELKKQLGEKVPFFSIIVFYGDSELQDISFIPQGTFVSKSYRIQEIISGILQYNLLAHYKNKENVIKVLKQAVKNGEEKGTDQEHISNIKDMIGKDRVFD